MVAAWLSHLACLASSAIVRPFFTSASEFGSVWQLQLKHLFVVAITSMNLCLPQTFTVEMFLCTGNDLWSFSSLLLMFSKWHTTKLERQRLVVVSYIHCITYSLYLDNAVEEDNDVSGLVLLSQRCSHPRYCPESGAHPNAATRSGRATPLHRAAYMGHLHIVQTLLQAGADASLQDSDGESALHKAASQGHARVLDLLSERFPEAVQIVDRKGRTPQECLLCGAMQS
eukprot:jgi/Botrbrau1/16711/Bobra.0270s0002.1